MAISDCPECGKTMCQQFDDKPGPNGITLAIPNGEYKCNWCGYDTLKEQEKRP